MKKLLFFMFMAVTTLSLTSCDDDEIARKLDGVWEGQVSLGRWNSYQYVDIQFSRQGYADGYGVEYDYQSNGSYEECPFTFDVNNHTIFMTYDDGTKVAIRNYDLTDTRFAGEFCYWTGSYSVGAKIADFEFYKVTNWRHSRYNNYYYEYTKSPDNDSVSIEVKK